MICRPALALGVVAALLAPGLALAHGKVPAPAGEVTASEAADGPVHRRPWLVIRPTRAQARPSDEEPPSRFHQPWTNDVPVWHEESYCDPAPYVVMHALPAS